MASSSSSSAVSLASLSQSQNRSPISSSSGAVSLPQALSLWLLLLLQFFFFFSVLMLREQIASTVASCSTSFSAQNFPTSVLLQEQRDEYRPLLHISKEDRTCQAILNTKQMDMVSETGASDALTTTLPRLTVDSKRPAVSLGRKALSPSKKAASVAEDSGSIKVDEDADKSVPFGLASAHLANPSLQSNKTVRSTRRLERRLKQRKVPKSKVKDNGKDDAQEGLHVEKKKKEGSDLNLLLQSPDTKQLLTSEQESQLIAQIQELMRLEELKTSLQSQFGREATIAEWADSAGLNCRALKAQLRRGNRSREKLVQANLRMVHHIAKTYQGRGISHEDLLQEGSAGLLKSVKKFKPQAGCRFGTYAYWWIKQAIRKAIFNHSRTIRLPHA